MTPEKWQKAAERTPITRLRSETPKDGYYWDVLWQTYMEGDALLRERFRKQTSAWVMSV
jgi:hypothetical protein